jgi:hypothetical protein
MSCISAKLKRVKRILNTLNTQLPNCKQMYPESKRINVHVIKAISMISTNDILHISYKTDKRSHDVFIKDLSKIECERLIHYLNTIKSYLIICEHV